MIRHQAGNSQSNHYFNLSAYKGTDWYPHFHKSFEMITVTKGSIDCTVNAVKKTVRAGEYVLVLSNRIHSVHCTEKSEYFIAVFSEDFVGEFARKMKGLEGNDFVFNCSPEVTALIKRYLIESSGELFMKKACFYALCSEYLRSVTLNKKTASADFAVGRVLDYIGENYLNNPTLKECAAALNFEYHYLSRLMGKGYRISFKGTLNEYRTQAAKELLLTSDMPLSQVAFESGFQSVRSFNGVFKSLVGVTPSQFRRGN